MDQKCQHSRVEDDVSYSCLRLRCPKLISAMFSLIQPTYSCLRLLCPTLISAMFSFIQPMHETILPLGHDECLNTSAVIFPSISLCCFNIRSFLKDIALPRNNCACNYPASRGDENNSLRVKGFAFSFSRSGVTHHMMSLANCFPFP